MEPNRPQYLISKYLTRQASVLELDELSKWIEEPENEEEFITYVKLNYAIDFNMKKFDADHSKKQLLKTIERDKRTLRVWNITKVAAAIAVLISAGYFFRDTLFGNSNLIPSIEQSVVDSGEIEPGSDKAVLTLEDGSTVHLEKGKTVKTENLVGTGKELVYEPSNSEKGKIIYNQLTIPRGGQYQLKLADGTLVWLNSESKLRYPVAFVEGKTREVELLYGEAYFEVSPSSLHQGAKFKVLHPSQEIEVLGTEFNIKAYGDDSSIHTTLVEGSVSVHGGNSHRTLKPNQQSILDLDSKEMNIEEVNVSLEISWRKGIFGFKSKSMEEIGKVLSRWYDVDIEFSNPAIKEMKFNGVLSKSEPIVDILNSILSTNAIQDYEIDQKRIILK